MFLNGFLFILGAIFGVAALFLGGFALLILIFFLADLFKNVLCK